MSAFVLNTMPLLGLSMEAVVGSGAGLGVLILALVAITRNFLYLCRPNEILIFTGRTKESMIISGRGEGRGGGRGRAWRIPIIERVDRMEVTTISTDIVVQNAYSAGNIPLRIHAVANVKIHTEPEHVRNAVTRFLHKPPQEIQLVAQQTLEGALREVLAQMTPEAVNEDRLAFADNLVKAARDDLDKLGLQLDTLKIQSVSDDTGYLDSLGRPKIAAALRDAENAENQAQQEITQAQAEANRRAEVAKANAEKAILIKRNELAKLQAELDGEARAVEEEARAAALTARAEAEKQLQEVRRTLETQRLQADVVVPAEVDRRALAILAKGDAAPTIETGAAMIQVLNLTAEAWRQMGDRAREIFVIQHLDQLVAQVVNRVEDLQVGEVHVLDPGDGSAFANYAAAYPKTVAAVLGSLREVTGVDVPGILAGNSTGGSTPPPGSGPARPGGSKFPSLGQKAPVTGGSL